MLIGGTEFATVSKANTCIDEILPCTLRPPPHRFFASDLLLLKDVSAPQRLEPDGFILNFDFDLSKNLKRGSNMIRSAVARKLDITST